MVDLRVRRIFLILTFIGLLFVFSGIKVVEAETESKLQVVGAKVRTEGNQGITFVGEASGMNEVKKYGIAIAYGKTSEHFDILSTVNGYKVLYTTVNAVDENNYFYITLYGMGVEDYTTKVTAIAFVIKDDGTYVYSDEVKTRSLYYVSKMAIDDGLMNPFLQSVILSSIGELTEQTNADEYNINTANDLFNLAYRVNNGLLNSKVTVNLLNDIDLKNIDFTPIGNRPNSFNNVFNGNNFTIKNLYISNPDLDRQALFGYSTSPSISNLNLLNVDITGKMYVSCLVAEMFSPGKTIENVNVTNFSINGLKYLAGIVGHSYASVINCSSTNGVVKTDITFEDYKSFGGIVGYICSSQNNLEIKDNLVTNVTITGYQNLGGIAGALNLESVSKNTTVSNNTVKNVTIFALGDTTENGPITGKLYYPQIIVENNYYEQTNIFIQNEPILIKTYEDFLSIENNPSGYYLLNNDLDLSNKEWDLFDFNGVLDGNNKTITVNKEQKIPLSLFSCAIFKDVLGSETSQAVIKNLNVTVDVITDYESEYATLCRYLENAALVNCSFSGQLEGSLYFSGIVFYASGKVKMEKVISNLNITSNVTSTIVAIGGFVYRTYNDTEFVMKDCIMNGSITHAYSESYGSDIGYFVAKSVLANGNTTLINCSVTKNASISANLTNYQTYGFNYQTNSMNVLNLDDPINYINDHQRKFRLMYAIKAYYNVNFDNTSDEQQEMLNYLTTLVGVYALETNFVTIRLSETNEGLMVQYLYSQTERNEIIYNDIIRYLENTPDIESVKEITVNNETVKVLYDLENKTLNIIESNIVLNKTSKELIFENFLRSVYNDDFEDISFSNTSNKKFVHFTSNEDDIICYYQNVGNKTYSFKLIDLR